MLKLLKKIFPTFIIYDENQPEALENYKWFLTEDKDIIGIDKNELNEKELAILTAFLTPYHLNLPEPTDQEIRWKKRVTTGKESGIPDQMFRFIHFSYKKNQLEPYLFKRTIQEFFSMPISILWENDHEGVIIEQQQVQLEEEISYDQIMTTLMSELYVKVTFLVGPYFTTYIDLPNHYSELIKLAKVTSSYTEKNVITFVDAIPFYLVDQLPINKRMQISSLILKEFKDDEDALNTFRTFIQCNLNISVTAKKLYMHRNSLQYRIDKFYEKTGIDIRQFDQAVTVYLSLLSNMHKE